MAPANLEDLDVVVVDDHRPSRMILETILRALRIEKFQMFDHPEAAFERIKSHQPHLLITDLEMEPTDGLELVKWVRQDETALYAYLPIILVTGNMSEEVKRKAYNGGVHEVLYKPLSVESIHSTVAEIIERPPPFVKAQSYFGPDRRRTPRDEGSGPETRA